MIPARSILAELKSNGVTHIVGIPDNGSRALYHLLQSDTGIQVVLVSREGEAFGLAAGLYIGGCKPLVLIQNTGFLESGDALRGMVFNLGIPLVILIGYRGYSTMKPDSPRVDTAAAFLEPTLKAWNIPYILLQAEDSLVQLSVAFVQAAATSRPVAILFAGELI